MAEAGHDFATLMQRIREGSQEAARELLEDYGPHVFRVVRRRLHRRLRSKFDSSDFVQAVWASFFALQPREFRFDSPEELVGFLVNLARNKVVDTVRQRLASLKYDVHREQSLDDSRAVRREEIVAHQPTPSQIAVAKEQWDRLLQQTPAHHRQILDLLRQGNTHLEIAHKLGMDEKTIRRLIRRIAPEGRSCDEPTHIHSLPAARLDRPAP
jgi:RNA polymerase sigma factor (sigma-70 family)